MVRIYNEKPVLIAKLNQYRLFMIEWGITKY